jgi:hypothetical protein
MERIDVDELLTYRADIVLASKLNEIVDWINGVTITHTVSEEDMLKAIEKNKDVVLKYMKTDPVRCRNCGGAPTVQQESKPSCFEWYVKCEHCGATTGLQYNGVPLKFMSREDAIKAWNEGGLD